MTDSGWIEPAVRATVAGVDDGVALGVGLTDGDGDVVVDGDSRGAIWALQPASSNAAATPLRRKASMVTVERARR